MTGSPAARVAEQAQALRDACESWPTPNRYTDALDGLLSVVATLQQERDEAREALAESRLQEASE